MALNISKLQEKVAAKKAKIANKKSAAYKAVNYTNRAVLATQPLRKSEDLKVLFKVYDPKVLAELASKGKLGDNFAQVLKVEDKMYLVKVSADQMAKVQTLQGKSTFVGSENFQLVIPKGENAGETKTVDNRRQTFNMAIGTKVKNSRNCVVFEVPSTQKLQARLRRTFGDDLLSQLDKRNFKFEIGEMTNVVLPIKTNEKLENGAKEKHEVRYKTVDMPFKAWELKMTSRLVEPKEVEVVSNTTNSDSVEA